MAMKSPTSGGSSKGLSRLKQERAMSSRGGSQPLKKKVAKKAEAARIKKNSIYVGYGTTHVTGQGNGRVTKDRSKSRAIKTALGNVIAVPKNAGMDSVRPKLGKKIAAARVQSGKVYRSAKAEKDFLVKGAKKAAKKSTLTKAKKAGSMSRQESAMAKRGGSQPAKVKKIAGAKILPWDINNKPKKQTLPWNRSKNPNTKRYL